MNILFKNNKYTKWYFNIINSAGSLLRSKKDDYYESHHIIPRAFNGTNQKSNLVLLTPREHFLCHLLLPKMMINSKDAGKMAYAFFRMKHKHKNSKIFDRFRTAYGKLTTGENNKFFGKIHSPETLKKISRLGKYHTAESKALMSKVKVGKNCGKDNPMFGTKHTEEWCKNHSVTMSGENHFNYGKDSFVKGRIWIHNTTLSKMIQPAELTDYIIDGWSKGRLPK